MFGLKTQLPASPPPSATIHFHPFDTPAIDPAVLAAAFDALFRVLPGGRVARAPRDGGLAGVELLEDAPSLAPGWRGWEGV